MNDQKEFTVVGQRIAYVHQNVKASSPAAARRKAAANHDGWWYNDNQADHPIKIISVQEDT